MANFLTWTSQHLHRKEVYESFVQGIFALPNFMLKTFFTQTVNICDIFKQTRRGNSENFPVPAFESQLLLPLDFLPNLNLQLVKMLLSPVIAFCGLHCAKTQLNCFSVNRVFAVMQSRETPFPDSFDEDVHLCVAPTHCRLYRLFSKIPNCLKTKHIYL